MIATGSVKVGIHLVATVTVDPTDIMGAGGTLSPHLVIPTTITMLHQSDDHQTALPQIHAELFDSPHSAVPLTHTALPLDFRRRSVQGGHDYHVQLSFPLTPGQAEHLDARRHSSNGSEVTFYLRLTGPLAWLRHTGNSASPSGESSLGEGGWPTSMGLWSDVAWFWESDWQCLKFAIPVETWTIAILPKWDLDRYRLVEVAFPAVSEPGQEHLARQWDRAWSAYTNGRYADAIGHLRGILNVVNRQLQATKQKPLATVMANRRAWGVTDPRRESLDRVWESLLRITNSELHPEDDAPEWTVSDCRWLLHLVASTLDYLAE